MKLKFAAKLGAMLSAVFLIACGENLTKEIITFKGVELGVPGVRGSLAKPCQPPVLEYACDNGKSNFYFRADYGNLKNVLVLAIMTDNGMIAKIEIEAPKNDIRELAGYLQEKYGDAKIEKDQAENKMGNKYDRETYVWKDRKGNRIVLQSIYDNIHTGHVELIAWEMFKVQGEANKKEIEVYKKNL